MASTAEVQLEQRDSLVEEEDHKSQSSKGWKDVDLKKPLTPRYRRCVQIARIIISGYGLISLSYAKPL